MCQRSNDDSMSLGMSVHAWLAVGDPATVGTPRQGVVATDDLMSAEQFILCDEVVCFASGKPFPSFPT